MGATFDTRRYPGTLTKDEVRERFADDQHRCRHDNGHSYSGGIGMANGLEFGPKPPFADAEEGYRWLEANALKWEAALAVQAKRPDGSLTWLIGAWCSS